MKPTPHLRFIERLSPNDGPADRVLQQWHKAEGWEHEDYVKAGGEWQDVELMQDTNQRPVA